MVFREQKRLYTWIKKQSLSWKKLYPKQPQHIWNWVHWKLETKVQSTSVVLLQIPPKEACKKVKCKSDNCFKFGENCIKQQDNDPLNTPAEKRKSCRSGPVKVIKLRETLWWDI